jgi:4'-phosphopantetheinyl transferase
LREVSNVDVWLISLEREGQTILSADEEIRAARFRFNDDRARWIRAHSALRVILAACTGLSARELRFSVGPHGKPAVVDGMGVEFSLSHAGCWAMVAVTRGIPVGVDIERIRENVNMGALLRRLGEQVPEGGEADLYRVWTRREAMSKAVGGALLEPPAGDLRVTGLDAPAGYVAALALLGFDPRVRRQDAPVL